MALANEMREKIEVIHRNLALRILSPIKATNRQYGTRKTWVKHILLSIIAIVFRRSIRPNICAINNGNKIKGTS